MAAMQKQVVVSLSDLRYVTVLCKSCGGSITMDLAKESDHQLRFGFTPVICSICHVGRDTSIKYLDQLQMAYKALLGIADVITFRGEAESAEPSASGARASSDED